MSNWLAIDTNTSAAGGWTNDQRKQNVDIMYKYFRRKKHWSIESIAAMLGNMQYESWLNPGQWETGFPKYQGGFGLVQWTPYTNFSSWAGPDWETDYDLQMERIQYEMENGLQWIPTATYNFSFQQFTKMKKSDHDIEYLTKAFEYCYERGTWSNQRVTYAEYWYKYLKKKELLFFLIITSGGRTGRVKGVYTK